jgi:mono/diheme cytochrome c family protein
MFFKGRRWLRIAGVCAIALVTLAAAVVGGVVLRANVLLGQNHEVACKDIEIPDDEASIARGKYLVNHMMLCIDCHGEDLSGVEVINDGMLGRVVGANLTSGKGSVTLDYSGRDWDRAIRHGLSPSGRPLVFMPSEDYVNFSDADIGAVAAYIKSLPPVDKVEKKIALGPLGYALIGVGVVKLAYDKIDHDREPPSAERGPTREWGEVLIGSCTGCHGPGLSGGAIPGAPPDWPLPRNLTPHESGLKGWSYEDFTQAMTEGVRPDGSEINPFMPWKAYAGMDETDRKALWEYIRQANPKPAGGR